MTSNSVHYLKTFLQNLIPLVGRSGQLPGVTIKTILLRVILNKIANFVLKAIKLDWEINKKH